MITLQLLQLLQNNGLGTIDVDLFWEKMGLGKEGVYVSSLGEATTRGARRAQTYELYSRGDSDVSGYKNLLAIAEFINSAYRDICTLPSVQNPNGEVIAEELGNVAIMPLSSISSNGLDANGRTIFSATGRIIY